MTRLYAAFLSLFLLLNSGSALADRGNVIPGDYDRDGRTDIVVTRAVDGLWNWYIRYANSLEFGPIVFGLAPQGNTDTLLPGDFDGDGIYDLNVVRDTAGFLNWFARSGATGEISQVVWGISGDIPLTGYYGGNGETDRVAIRDVNSALVWYIQNIAPNGISWGLTGDVPFAGDYTGNDVDDLIVARTEAGQIVWYIRNLDGSVTARVPWGLEGDTLLPPSDFDGNGTDDLVVARNFGNFKVFFIRYSGIELSTSVAFGLASDKPYIGFFTQGAMAELAVFRPGTAFGTHFVRFAGDGQVVSVPFGLSRDTLSRPQRAVNAEDEGVSAIPGCAASPGTATDFLDGARRGALWKPVSEGVSNAAPVVLLPISYCGASISVLGSDGAVVSGVQRVKCGGNGNRAHFWIARTASALSQFQPLTVQVSHRGSTECRSVPVARQRYD